MRLLLEGLYSTNGFVRRAMSEPLKGSKMTRRKSTKTARTAASRPGAARRAGETRSACARSAKRRAYRNTAPGMRVVVAGTDEGRHDH
jgi:hypothetical protein